MTKKLMLVLILLVMVSGCGGGGGGTTSGISYTGVTSPATLTQTNAQEITLDAMDGTGMSSIVGGALSIKAAGGNSSLGVRDLSAAVNRVELLISQIDLSQFPSAVTAATETVSDAGPCGGSLSGTFNVNDITGSFSATMSFNNYRDYDSGSMGSCSMGNGPLMSGSISLSSDSNYTQFPQTGANITLNLSTFTVVGDGVNMTLSGSGDMTSLSTTKSQISLSLSARDNLTGETYKTENFTDLTTDFGSYQTEELSGRYYTPAYGYVDILTTAPVETDSSSTWPRAGIVKFSGAPGSEVTVTFGTTSAIGTGTDGQGNDIYFEYVYESI